MPVISWKNADGSLTGTRHVAPARGYKIQGGITYVHWVYIKNGSSSDSNSEYRINSYSWFRDNSSFIWDETWYGFARF